MDWNAKVGSQEIPGVTGKFGHGVQSEAGHRLTDFFQEKAMVMANTSSNNTRYNYTHGHHQIVNTEIRLIIFAAEDGRSSIQSAKTRQGENCGSDHELLIAKFRLIFKKVRKTTRPFR